MAGWVGRKIDDYIGNTVSVSKACVLPSVSHSLWARGACITMISHRGTSYSQRKQGFLWLATLVSLYLISPCHSLSP